jgi:hypothetical protein
MRDGSLFSNYERAKIGRPPFTYFFNVVANMLAVLIKSSKDQDMFDGPLPHLVDSGLSIFVICR